MFVFLYRKDFNITILYHCILWVATYDVVLAVKTQYLLPYNIPVLTQKSKDF